MKIGIVAPSPVPFVLGGAERLWSGLLDEINGGTPHDADLVKLPSREHNLPDLMATYEAFSELDLSHFDVVISGKYPAWMVHHERHVLYMAHPLRGLYDTYHLTGLPTHVRHDHPALRGLDGAVDLVVRDKGRFGLRPIFDSFRHALATLGRDHPAFGFPGPLARRLVHALDAVALDPARMAVHATISRTVAGRPGYLPPSADVRAIIPPSSLRGLHPGPYRHIVTASRLDGPKRIDLLVKAMRYVPQDVRLLIAGTGPEAARLRALAAPDPRIGLLGFVPDANLVELYANALAVAFVPADEDLGYITLEAQSAAKAVITTNDSGGAAELVLDGVDGFVTEPRPAALGAAFSRLAADPALAERLGRAGARKVAPITWAAVVSDLLAPVLPHPAQRTVGAGPGAPASASDRPWEAGTRLPVRRRPRIVVLSTYAPFPPRGGGQLRCAKLYGGLADTIDVDLVTLDDAGGHPGTRRIAPGIEQIVVGRSPEQFEHEARLGHGTGIPVSDIAAATAGARLADYRARVAERADGADAVLLAHPYLLPVALEAAPGLPIVYDAHNAEHVLKDAMLPAGTVGDGLRAIVRDVEQRAVRSARLVVTCSPADREALEVLGPTLADWLEVPNGTDVTGTPFVTGPDRRRRAQTWLDAFGRAGGRAGDHLAMFVGSLHEPNVDAARAVLDIARRLPTLTFVIAGSVGRALSPKEAPTNVVLRGVVDDVDLRNLFHAADVGLNPMRTGSGTNLKLVDYLAAGTPVVASTVGVRGVDVVDGVHALVADDLDAAAAAIVRVIDDPAGAEYRATRARQLAARYDWGLLADRLRDALLALTDRERTPVRPGR